MGCETAKRSAAQGIRGLPRHRAVCSTKTQREEELKWQDGGSKEKVVWPYLFKFTVSGRLARDEPSFVGHWVCVIVF